MFCEWLENNNLNDIQLNFDILPDINNIYWKNARKSYIADAEKYLNYEWLPITADMWLDFSKNGNRSRMEDRHFARRTALCKLVEGELAEQKGRFLNDIVNGIFAICEESFWGVSAHLENNKILPTVENPTIDLFSAQTAGNLAIVYNLLHDKLDEIAPNISTVILNHLKKRIKEPFESRDFWWTGKSRDFVNNWNPWIISNVLSVYLFASENGDEKINGVRLCLETEDYYIRSCLSDGGCDEGVSYWGVATGCVFDTIEQLYLASGGKIDFFKEPLIQKMGMFALDTHICDNLFLNFADGKNHPEMWGSLLYRFGKYIDNNELSALGCVTYENDRRQSYMLRRELMQMGEIPTMDCPKHKADAYFDKLQLTVCRKNDFILATKGGHNDESHNHNDVGSISVFVDDKPLLIDIGVGEYTAKTFSPQRYELKPMQSSWHTLPEINGVMEHNGREFCTDSFDFENGVTSLDFASAFEKNAGIRHLSRQTCIKDEGIEICDSFEFENEQNTVCENFIFIDEPSVKSDGIHVGKCLLTIPNDCKVELDFMDISNEGWLKMAWDTDKIWRIRVVKVTKQKNLI